MTKIKIDVTLREDMLREQVAHQEKAYCSTQIYIDRSKLK